MVPHMPGDDGGVGGGGSAYVQTCYEIWPSPFRWHTCPMMMDQLPSDQSIVVSHVARGDDDTRPGPPGGCHMCHCSRPPPVSDLDDIG